jgi:hypothetical protein
MLDVRFGSKADICAAKSHERFAPESGHLAVNVVHETPPPKIAQRE